MIPACVVEILDAEGLRRLVGEQWDDLSANAVDENPFYARSYILAGLDTIDKGRGLKAVAIHSGGRLVGLFPFTARRWPLSRAVAAANLYQPGTEPLIHRDHAETVVIAWLDAIDRGLISRRWTFVNLGLGSGFVKLCQAAGRARTIDVISSGAYARARLTRISGGFGSHLQRAVSKSRVKDIERAMRRLGEQGELRFERQRDPQAVARRVEDFLAIEHSGWKGAAGTSFLTDQSHADFARRAFTAAGNSVDSLLLDGEPIAISINLQTGGTIFTPKCAYDERFRKFSPGLVLEYLVIEAFYRQGDCTEMDSSTTVDGHVIQGLWNDEARIGTVMLGPQGWQTRLLSFAHEAEREARCRAKAALATPSLKGALTLARQMRRKVQVVQHNVMIGGAGLAHAVEMLAPAL